MKYLKVPTVSIFRNKDEVSSTEDDFDFTLIDSATSHVEILGSREARVWELLSEFPERASLMAKYSLETSEFEDAFVDKLLQKWVEVGFVLPEGKQVRRQNLTWWQRLIWIEFSVNNLDKYFAKLYQKVFRSLATWPVYALAIGLISSGAYLGVVSIIYGRVNLFQQLDLGLFVLILALGLFFLSIHEAAHGIAMKWAGAPIIRAGVALYLGLPVLFVDTSTIWASPRRQRVITAAAGIFANTTIAAACIWLTYIVSQPFLNAVLWEIVLINIFMAGFSAIPFLKLDMYYILMDMTGIPNLGSLAYSNLKNLVTSPFAFGYSLRNLLLVIFAVLSGIGSLFLLIYSILYWWRLILAFIYLVS